MVEDNPGVGCDGCGNIGALMDGHFCGFCHSEISRAVRVALDDTDAVSVDQVIASGINKDGNLMIEVDLE